MKSIVIIGCGAIAVYVAGHLTGSRRASIAFVVSDKGTEARAKELFGDDVAIRYDFESPPVEPDLVVDCAGHPALRAYGETVLKGGIDLCSVSSGALADKDLHDRLLAAAVGGGSQLRIVSGAIGALDALSAASVGGLDSVTYRGRKPPKGWVGSPAEKVLDLGSLTEAAVHFSGSARAAALQNPKTANVAASGALAGAGFDATDVEQIADPGVSRNSHEIVAEGGFGRFEFRIEGNSLPDNPRSSAITAMSVVRDLGNRVSPLII